MSKNKAPLVEELGEQYINDFFRGAMFLKDGLLMKVHTCMNGSIRVSTLTNDDPKAAWGTSHISAADFKGFEDFSWPKLGYRNLSHTTLGNVVCYVTCARSTLRGLRPEHIGWEILPVCDLFSVPAFSGTGAGSDKYRYLKIFFPEWMTYKEGMNKLKEKKIPAFALNEDIAIGLSTESGTDRFCDIHFRQKVVGSIAHNGQMLISNKVIKKGHLKKLYRMLEE